MKKELISLFAITLVAPVISLAQRGNMPNPTKEQRNSMAAMHEKMATCLKTDKSLDECRNEMHASCEQMGPEMCGMGMGMGMKKMGHPGRGKGMGPKGQMPPAEGQSAE